MVRQTILLLLILAGCNPYRPYSNSHINILAELDPLTGRMEVNLQMVYLSKTDHTDSIVFMLNENFSILSLSAQELHRYEMYDAGKLVLYIQEAVPSGDRIHISMSYAGLSGCKLKAGESRLDVDAMKAWLPVREDIPPLTYRLRVTLPQGFRVENSDRTKEAVNMFTLEETQPAALIRFSITDELP